MGGKKCTGRVENPRSGWVLGAQKQESLQRLKMKVLQAFQIQLQEILSVKFGENMTWLLLGFDIVDENLTRCQQHVEDVIAGQLGHSVNHFRIETVTSEGCFLEVSRLEEADFLLADHEHTGIKSNQLQHGTVWEVQAPSVRPVPAPNTSLIRQRRDETYLIFPVIVPVRVYLTPLVK